MHGCRALRQIATLEVQVTTTRRLRQKVRGVCLQVGRVRPQVDQECCLVLRRPLAGGRRFPSYSPRAGTTAIALTRLLTDGRCGLSRAAGTSWRPSDVTSRAVPITQPPGGRRDPMVGCRSATKLRKLGAAGTSLPVRTNLDSAVIAVGAHDRLATGAEAPPIGVLAASLQALGSKQKSCRSRPARAQMDDDQASRSQVRNGAYTGRCRSQDEGGRRAALSERRSARQSSSDRWDAPCLLDLVRRGGEQAGVAAQVAGRADRSDRHGTGRRAAASAQIGACGCWSPGSQ